METTTSRRASDRNRTCIGHLCRVPPNHSATDATYPETDSNRHRAGLKPAASSDWATRAWRRWDSNPRHPAYEAGELPTALRRCGPGRIRTASRHLARMLLYRWSYRPAEPMEGIEPPLPVWKTGARPLRHTGWGDHRVPTPGPPGSQPGVLPLNYSHRG